MAPPAQQPQGVGSSEGGGEGGTRQDDSEGAIRPPSAAAAAAAPLPDKAHSLSTTARSPPRNDDGKKLSSTTTTTSRKTAAPLVAAESSKKGSNDKKKTAKKEKDRTKLRKGKWTVEEEEYTSRIIHYFGTGLLSLPEGTTLRSYLADKLNCDPMRITKKYAGASCLGRRAFHLSTRPQPSIAEIQLARAELDHLENRFRLCIEEGRASLNCSMAQMLPSSAMMLGSLSSAAAVAQPMNPLMLQSLLAGLSGAAAPAPGIPAVATAAAGLNPVLSAMQAFHQPGLSQFALQQQQQQQQQPIAPQLFGGNAGQLALAINPPAMQQAPAPETCLASAQAQAVSALLSSLTLSQIAAALAPALSQAAGMGSQQQQQQQQQQPFQQPRQQLNPPVAQAAADSGRDAYLARELQATYEKHMRENGLSQVQPPPPSALKASATRPVAPSLVAALSGLAKTGSSPAVTPPTAKPAAEVFVKTGRPLESEEKKPAAKPPQVHVIDDAPDTGANVQQPPAKKAKLAPRTQEEEADGTILVGFLNSLRQSYEEAVRDKRPREETPAPATDDKPAVERPATSYSPSKRAPLPLMKRARQPATNVTDYSGSSTNQGESSPEDSDSDKKTDSSEDDKKATDSGEDSDNPIQESHFSKGPPRKRLKSMRTGLGMMPTKSGQKSA